MPAPAIDEQRVRQIIAAVYNRSVRERELDWMQIDEDSLLYSASEGDQSLGLDSLDAVEIATELEEEFDVVMPMEIDPSELQTVKQVVSMLQQLAREQHVDE